MAEIKVEIPEELREEMKELPNVNWQLVLRRTLKRELEENLELKRIISKSKLSEEDVEELSDKILERKALPKELIICLISEQGGSLFK
jgi:hypothetical protein